MLMYVKSKRVARHVNYKGKKRIVNLREMILDHRNYLDLELTRKPVFRLSDHARLKPTYSVTEIS